MAKVGRPTEYKPEYAAQARNYCILGATDEFMASCFGVSVQTIGAWKHKQPEFLDAIKNGKMDYDLSVGKSLHSRALGYSCEEEKVFLNEGEIVTHKVTKHHPPDTTAAIFWLKNRQPDAWREKQQVEVTTPTVTVKDLTGK